MNNFSQVAVENVIYYWFPSVSITNDLNNES